MLGPEKLDTLRRQLLLDMAVTNDDVFEPSPDHIIRDLHRIREAILDSYGGDLHAYSRDCHRRLEESGWPVWKRPDTERMTATDREVTGDVSIPQPNKPLDPIDEQCTSERRPT